MSIKLVPLLSHNFDQTRHYFKTLTKPASIFCIDTDGIWYRCCKKGEPEYEVVVNIQQAFTAIITKK